MQLGVRGTEITMYDYAYCNKKILGNESIIIAPSCRSLEARSKFEKEFDVFLYKDKIKYDGIEEGPRSAITRICKEESVDALWVIKGGEIDGIVSDSCKNLIQCVFRCDQPHGDVYSVQTDYLNQKHNTSHPVVPCMIQLPEVKEDLRSIFNIPHHAMVLGRHGGRETWWPGHQNWVYNTIHQCLEHRKDLYFIFMNTDPFIQHERALFFPATTDLKDKVKFINTCDAMIHSRIDGETFGLSIAEFSINNKPVITNPHHCYDKAHIMMLGEKGLYYNDPQSLAKILLQINKPFIDSKNWDAYSSFTNPEFVMDRFKSVYLG
mgnify:CR=1 FL=1